MCRPRGHYRPALLWFYMHLRPLGGGVTSGIGGVLLYAVVGGVIFGLPGSALVLAIVSVVCGVLGALSFRD